MNFELEKHMFVSSICNPKYAILGICRPIFSTKGEYSLDKIRDIIDVHIQVSDGISKLQFPFIILQRRAFQCPMEEPPLLCNKSRTSDDELY